MDRLAEDYLLDSDASVGVVIGLDIKYRKRGSRRATISVWRAREFHTAAEVELRVVEEATDEVYYFKLKFGSSLTSDILIRRFVTMKASLRTTQGCGFASAILPTRNWHATKLQTEIENWSLLLSNFANTLPQRRPSYNRPGHSASI